MSPETVENRYDPLARVCALVAVTALMACSAPSAAPSAPSTERGAFPNGEISLSYRLDRPGGVAPFPAVVIGHGSGMTTQNDAQMLADGFLSRGYAALRYDKRGVGQSTGTYSGVGVRNSERMFADLSSDMAAALEFLRKQRDIIRDRVGLMGSSQAGWIMPLAAGRAHAAFMIAISGPTVSVGEEIYFSDFAEGKGPIEDAYEKLARFTGPRGFDPVPVLETLNVPSLWLLGQADDSIPERNTVAILKGLIARGRPFAFIEYPNANHGLVNVATGRFSPIFQDIDNWFARR